MHEILQRTTVIPVVTIPRAADAVPLASALLRAGLRVIEVTLRTPEALAAITAIARGLPDVVVGAGTVLTGADVTRAADAGARFLVSPGLTPDLVAAGLGSELPYIPGAVTPSEVIAAREQGFSVLKFFPAEPSGGVEALRHLAPVFPGIAFCPTGGIGEGNAAKYLALPNVPMVGGAWMTPAEAIAAGNWAEIEELARRAVRIAQSRTL
ncbi:MAG TPA: bifunctional 4-hydroxy-2-oxoglutarate aldolase/2-dehydro-3-deoxy-phosphogluconate aldolase [Stellaceae bacterium]|nr:bifunctional 4-hydroxy-2-oxoglutarate aldolase/2-dehydro-3-deoxy-phosphogluconate aldolase [Stellaceae bacterium]